MLLPSSYYSFSDTIFLLKVKFDILLGKFLWSLLYKPSDYLDWHLFGIYWSSIVFTVVCCYFWYRICLDLPVFCGVLEIFAAQIVSSKFFFPPHTHKIFCWNFVDSVEGICLLLSVEASFLLAFMLLSLDGLILSVFTSLGASLIEFFSVLTTRMIVCSYTLNSLLLGDFFSSVLLLVVDLS